MHSATGPFQVHPQVPQNLYDLYQQNPLLVAHSPNEITSADSARTGKGYVDHALSSVTAFATHQWSRIEFPAVSPVPPAYPTAIDQASGLSPANAAAVGRNYFHHTVSSVKNFVMAPVDTDEIEEPLEIIREEGLSAHNTGIIGRRVIEDILSAIIESGLKTVALIYSVGRAIINVAKRALGIPIIEEPAANLINPEQDANDLDALDELDDLDETQEDLALEEEDPQIDLGGDEDDPFAIDDPAGGDPAVAGGVPIDFEDDEVEDDPNLALPDQNGLAAQAAPLVINPALAAAGNGAPAALVAAVHAQPRRVQNQRQQVAQQPPKPAAPPPRIEDTDPFYTQFPTRHPLLTQSQNDDLTWVLTMLNGSAGGIAMNAVKLRNRGGNVDVHPFRFLVHVMNIQDMRDKFKKLRERNDLFGTQFVAEFDAKFNGYQDRGELIPFHKGFAHAMRVNPKTVETLCNDKKWRLLILLLHETAAGTKAPFVPKVPVVRAAPQPAQPLRVAQPTRQALPRVQTAQPNLLAGPIGTAAPAINFAVPAAVVTQLGTQIHTPLLAEDDADLQDDLAIDDAASDGARTPVDLDPVEGVEGDGSDGEIGGDDLTAAAGVGQEVHEEEEEDDDDDLEALTACTPLTAQQQETTARIFDKVATSDPIALGFAIASLKSDWRQLQDTHPAMLLKEVFGNDAIVKNLRTINRDFTKRDLFINDLSDACAKGEQKNPDNTLTRTQETITELGLGRTLGEPIGWKTLIKELITLKCTTTISDALTPTQTEAIDQALTSIANTNEFMLLGHLLSLRKKWSSLEQGCPLQVLRYLFTQKQDLVRQIISQPIKKGPFLSDVATTLKNCSKMRDFSAHTAGFATEFGISEETLNRKEWPRVLSDIIAARMPPATLARTSSTASLPPPVAVAAAVVPLTPAPTSDPLSTVQKGVIDEIFSAIATKNELWLLANLVALERKWASLEQACPLQILRYVFTEKKTVFHQIIDKAIRRGPFLIDLNKTLRNSGKGRDLSSFADVFAQDFGVPKEMVTRKEWSSIIDTIKAGQIEALERASAASSSSTSTTASATPGKKIGNVFKGLGGMFGKKEDKK